MSKKPSVPPRWRILPCGEKKIETWEAGAALCREVEKKLAAGDRAAALEKAAEAAVLFLDAGLDAERIAADFEELGLTDGEVLSVVGQAIGWTEEVVEAVRSADPVKICAQAGKDLRRLIEAGILGEIVAAEKTLADLDPTMARWPDEIEGFFQTVETFAWAAVELGSDETGVILELGRIGIPPTRVQKIVARVFKNAAPAGPAPQTPLLSPDGPRPGDPIH